MITGDSTPTAGEVSDTHRGVLMNAASMRHLRFVLMTIFKSTGDLFLLINVTHALNKEDKLIQISLFNSKK